MRRAASVDAGRESIAKHFPLRSVLKHLDPVDQPPWPYGSALTENLVLEAYREQRFEREPIASGSDPDSDWLARRIAYFMQEGWWDPIELQLVLHAPSPASTELAKTERFIPKVAIGDGRCRMYAAVVMGHEFLFAQVQGDAELEKQLFWAGGADHMDHDEMIQLDAGRGTVWIHAQDGTCVGRFDSEMGMDVTFLAQLPTYAHLLHGGSDVFDLKDEWVTFRGLMQRHYGVVISPDLIRPSQVLRMRNIA